MKTGGAENSTDSLASESATRLNGYAGSQLSEQIKRGRTEMKRGIERARPSTIQLPS